MRVVGGDSRRLTGIAAGLGAAAIWGGMYVVSKYALAYAPPVTLVLLRLLIANTTLSVMAIAARAARVRRPDLPLMEFLGFVGRPVASWDSSGAAAYPRSSTCCRSRASCSFCQAQSIVG